jgi:hypothetical protein
MKIKKRNPNWLRPALTLVAVVIVVAGCASERIVWSPDGKHAAVIGGKGLYICDPDGKLSDLLVPDVVLAGWFPDSERLALARTVEYKTWKEAAAVMPEEQRGRIEDAARSVIARLKAGTEFNAALASVQGLSDREKSELGLCLRNSDGAQELAGSNWSFLQSIKLNGFELMAGSLADGKVTPGSVLASGLGAIQELRVSPGGAAIAYVADGTQKDELRLCVVPADGSAPSQVVAEQVAQYPDWGADGRSLYYVKAMHSAADAQELDLGVLTHRGVMDASGHIELQEKPDELAGLMFDPSTKVRCLNDGRILFSALPVQLPITKQDFPQHGQLYAFDPRQQGTLTRLIPQGMEETVPDNTGSFEVSPDGRRVCFLGEKHQVVVLTLADGGVETAQTNVESEIDGTFPVWRSTNELCFVSFLATNSATQNPQVVLWENGKSRALSEDWPAEVRKGLLEK